MSIPKICVVTGTRAEYGLLYGLMKGLEESGKFELQIVATATHLSPEFGLTYREIEANGFHINEKVEMLVSGDTAVAISKSIGLAVLGFADAFERLKPDAVVVLGDRFEMLAVAQCAMIARIPLAHIHGGEITEGAVDESIRHAISKMANIHFVATQEFRQRVIQMGEQPSRVFVSGAPGIDNIKRMPLRDKADIERSIDFVLGEVNFLVTYHPVTLSVDAMDFDLSDFFLALDNYPNAKIIITYPNSDADGRRLIEQLNVYAERNKGRVLLTQSLGFMNYLGVLPYIDCVIGNSSSGLLEVPSFAVPTVNIGDRQKGRVQAASVINCGLSKSSIITGIDKALSREFKESIQGVVNPYGDGCAAETILAIFEGLDFPSLIRKPFYDLDAKVDV
ncbi:UDP-N-acetylglucosamine 2-epimerase [Oceanicoccus sp. KOV_DT_Chl]|uniref:UDP-N-acetylglucosamine 2-epimerase n=1 Tax=Oceanicoccus sp. KOV_DT_Chl TaxID=1904639 RepID=UPI000C7AA2C5|nr:UDP-N-acetylglucosamine 2-epimerase [Oceanicoccus sp. KOV_DT_Chl]